jgi:hypothetical protein
LADIVSEFFLKLATSSNGVAFFHATEPLKRMLAFQNASDYTLLQVLFLSRLNAEQSHCGCD